MTLEETEGLINSAGSAGFEVRENVERERLRTTGTLRLCRGPFQLDLRRISWRYG